MSCYTELFSNEGDVMMLPESNIRKQKKTYAVQNFKNLSFSDVAQYFDLPILQAAEHLGVSESYLKRLCRTLAIKRWPFRRLHALYEKVDRLKANLDDKTDNTRTTAKIYSIEQEIEYIFLHGLKEETNKRKRNKNTSGVAKKRGRPPKKYLHDIAESIINEEKINDSCANSFQFELESLESQKDNSPLIEYAEIPEIFLPSDTPFFTEEETAYLLQQARPIEDTFSPLGLNLDIAWITSQLQ
jgi:hypothetical protein